MYYAFVVKTKDGWFAHKVLSDELPAAESRVRAAYASPLAVDKVRGGAKDAEDCGHSLYDRACEEAARRNRVKTVNA